MGCWALSGDATWGDQPETLSCKTIHAALDSGVNLFDTAEVYGDGRSEQVLGQGLAGRRQEALIATKFNQTYATASEVERACESSLRRLKTDYIDLYQMHWPSRRLPYPELRLALDRLLNSGKIRSFGVSNFGPNDLAEAIESRCLPVINQIPYSLLWRAAEYDVLAASMEAGIGVLCYSPLAQGLLTGKFSTADSVPEGRARTRLFSGQRPQARHGETGVEQITFDTVGQLASATHSHGIALVHAAIAWVLSRPGITSVVVGARSPSQIIAAANATQSTLSPELADQLSKISEPLKRRIGRNVDMWLADSRYR